MAHDQSCKMLLKYKIKDINHLAMTLFCIKPKSNPCVCVYMYKQTMERQLLFKINHQANETPALPGAAKFCPFA